MKCKSTFEYGPNSPWTYLPFITAPFTPPTNLHIIICTPISTAYTHGPSLTHGSPLHYCPLHMSPTAYTLRPHYLHVGPLFTHSCFHVDSTLLTHGPPLYTWGPSLHVGQLLTHWSLTPLHTHGLSLHMGPLLTHGPSPYKCSLTHGSPTPYTFGPAPYTLVPNPIAYTWALLTHGPSPYTWALSLHMLPYAWVSHSLHMVPLLTHGLFTYTWALSLHMLLYTWVPDYFHTPASYPWGSLHPPTYTCASSVQWQIQEFSLL